MQFNIFYTYVLICVDKVVLCFQVVNLDWVMTDILMNADCASVVSVCDCIEVLCFKRLV